jgi:predicted DNA-binding transcriptional regulator AlpA
MEKEYVTTGELAAVTGVSTSTWNKRRLTGDTPPFVKVGKSVRYHLPAAKAWMAERVRRSTSDITSSPAPAGA